MLALPRSAAAAEADVVDALADLLFLEFITTIYEHERNDSAMFRAEHTAVSMGFLDFSSRNFYTPYHYHTVLVTKDY